MGGRDRKKGRETSHAFQAMLKLGVEWTFEEREGPDFLVTSETGETFGLEVTDAYVGDFTTKGSALRRRESANEAWLAEIRRTYLKAGGPDLHLRYSGSTSPAAREGLLAALRQERFEDQPPLSSSTTINLPDGTAYAFRTPHASWTMLDDRSGETSRDGAHLQRAIDAKAAKLPAYRAVCPDVRLLVVATRIFRSGKLELEEGFQPDLRGFDAVYFFAYPSYVQAFTADGEPARP